MKKHVNPIWRSIAIVSIALVLAQFFISVSILDSKHPIYLYPPTYLPNKNALPPPRLEMTDVVTESGIDTVAEKENISVHPKTDIISPEGVAATVMLKAPKWFLRRYTAMIHNVLANIPST